MYKCLYGYVSMQEDKLHFYMAPFKYLPKSAAHVTNLANQVHSKVG